MRLSLVWSQPKGQEIFEGWPSLPLAKLVAGASTTTNRDECTEAGELLEVTGGGGFGGVLVTAAI